MPKRDGYFLTIVTAAEPDLVASATLTARTVTVACEGGFPGAVYRPVVEIVPSVPFPPVIPFTCQVTRVSAVFWTVAVNWAVRRTRTVAAVGDTVTETGRPLLTEILYAADNCPSG